MQLFILSHRVSPSKERRMPPEGHAAVCPVLVFSGVQLRWAHRLKVYVPRTLVFGDDAEEAMLFIGDAGGEVDSVTERQQVP